MMAKMCSFTYMEVVKTDIIGREFFIVLKRVCQAGKKYHQQNCSFRIGEMVLKILRAISGNFLFLFDIPDPDEHS